MGVKTGPTAAKARRERGREEMRRAILDAARDIVTKDGLGALSMRAVARAIGYSPAALYEYFPAKDDVLCALFFEGAGGLTDRMRATLASLPPGTSSLEALGLLGHQYRNYAHEQRELFLLVFAGEAAAGIGPGSLNVAEAMGGFRVLIDAARVGVERGDFLELEPRLIALGAWAAVHGFVMLELTGHLGAKSAAAARSAGEPHAPPLDELFDVTLDMIAYGFMRR